MFVDVWAAAAVHSFDIARSFCSDVVAIVLPVSVSHVRFTRVTVSLAAGITKAQKELVDCRVAVVSADNVCAVDDKGVSSSVSYDVVHFTLLSLKVIVVANCRPVSSPMVVQTFYLQSGIVFLLKNEY